MGKSSPIGPSPCSPSYPACSLGWRSPKAMKWPKARCSSRSIPDRSAPNSIGCRAPWRAIRPPSSVPVATRCASRGWPRTATSPASSSNKPLQRRRPSPPPWRREKPRWSGRVSTSRTPPLKRRSPDAPARSCSAWAASCGRRPTRPCSRSTNCSRCWCASRCPSRPSRKCAAARASIRPCWSTSSPTWATVARRSPAR